MMDIQLRLAPGLARQVGLARVSLALVDGATVADALRALEAEHPQAAALLAAAIPVIAGQLVSRSTALSAGQELALLLPVAGGSLVFHPFCVARERSTHDR